MIIHILGTEWYLYALWLDLEMSDPNLLLEWAINIMNTLGYPGIALLMFLENLLPPVPSEKIIMPLAGFVASRGSLQLERVVIAGVTGSVLGTLPWYYAGRYCGKQRVKQIADRHGRWLRISSQDIDKATRWFDRHSGRAVFICRLIPGVRSIVAIPAGISRMHLFPYLLYTALGTLIWLGFLAIAGYFLGSNYSLVEEYTGPLSIAVVSALGVAFLVWVWRRRQHPKK